VRNTREQSYPTNHPSVKPESENSTLRPSPSDIAVSITLYFEYCHRQPIWCFEREDVNDFASMHDELACSILALTLRLSENADQAKLYANNAKSLIMLRIANGTVDLATLESLCLLSYSSFIGMLLFLIFNFIICFGHTQANNDRWKCPPGSISPWPCVPIMSLR
jgi:hypothetical protein